MLAMLKVYESAGRAMTEAEARAWFDAKAADYPFAARTDWLSSPFPQEVSVPDYGQFVYSCQDGYRLWGFTTEEARDAFVKKHSGTAEPRVEGARA